MKKVHEVFSKRAFMKYRLHTPARDLRESGIGLFVQLSNNHRYKVGDLTEEQIIKGYNNNDLKYIRVTDEEMELVTKMNGMTREEIIDTFGADAFIDLAKNSMKQKRAPYVPGKKTKVKVKPFEERVVLYGAGQ